MSRRVPAWLPPCLMIAAIAWLTGCEADPGVPEGRIRVVQPEPMVDDPAVPDSNAVLWVSRRVAVRLGRPLDDVWALTDETVLPELSRAVWNANGLRVGLLSRDNARDFGLTLGETLEVRDTQILNYQQPEVLRRSAPLRAEFFADLTVPPMPVTQEYFTGGRLQLLMSSQPLGNGSTLLTLTPQHHVPKTSLLPRTAAEKVLDGRVFNELSIQIDVASTEALLIGLYLPAPPTPEESDDAPPAEQDPDDETQTPTGEPPADPPIDPDDENPAPPDPEQDPPEEARPEPPELNLGRGLFTTGLKKNDLQVFYLIRPAR